MHSMLFGKNLVSEIEKNVNDIVDYTQYEDGTKQINNINNKSNDNKLNRHISRLI